MDPPARLPREGRAEGAHPGAGRPQGSAEPGWDPGPLSLGRKVATAIITSVTYVLALISPRNRLLQAIKGPPLTPLK